MNTGKWLALGAALGAALAAGCLSTAAKQAYYTGTGASARYFEVLPLGGEQSLLLYRSVRVEDFDPSPMRGAVPSDMVGRVKAAIAARTREILSLAPGGEPALVIRGRFHDYDSGGSALRVVGFATDPFITAQIEIADAQTGKVLGVAMVTGTVRSGLRTGPDEMADGIGKAVKALLQSHMKVPEAPP
jgi:hypothetical protein